MVLSGLQMVQLQAQMSHKSKEVYTILPGDTLQLKSKAIVPFSEKITFNYPGIKYSYLIDYYYGKIWFPENLTDTITFEIELRVFTNPMSVQYALRNVDLLSSGDSLYPRDSIFDENTIFRPEKGKDNNLFDMGALQRSGSISRSVTVGNNQNLSVNSGLRLQLEGKIADDLSLIATITDENIPIQPDGTTQQINDFDKVFIQLKKQNDFLTLGDYEIKYAETEFANFYRNVQGAGVVVNGKSGSYQINAAVARGKFNTNSFSGQNGVQGPYRLTGKNGERFIILLAGSEKVYVNGELMRRGEGNDYTMDYNTGELTFTAQKLITNISRIVVDFEYSDRNYNRSTLFAQTSQSLFNSKVKFNFSYNREADNANAPIDPLSVEEKTILSQAGDNPLSAVSNGIDSLGISDTEVRYVRRDTVINNVLYERYIYEQNSDSSWYRIVFSYVGLGNGNYIRDPNLVNGSVFKWMPPDSLSGKPTGDYLPVRFLPLPALIQIADLRVQVAIGKKCTLISETAISGNDKNRLSDLDNTDNSGLANKLMLKWDNIKITDSTRLFFDISQRFVQDRFTNVDRINKVEYGRDWNFNDLNTRQDEFVFETNAGLNFGTKYRIKTGGGFRRFGLDINSFRNVTELSGTDLKAIQFVNLSTYIHTENKGIGLSSSWFRNNGDIYKSMKKWKPGIEVWIEDKSQSSVDSSSLGSFRFFDLKPYLRKSVGDKFSLDLSYTYRDDKEYIPGGMADKSISQVPYFKTIYNPKANIGFQLTSSYRMFKVLNPYFVLNQNLNNQNTLVANLQHNFFSFNKLLNYSLLYEITSQQIARRDIRFIKVTEGQGQYEWNDLNNNGIEELQEFILSYNSLRANYVRVLVPGTALVPVNSINTGGSCRIEFKKVIKDKKNIFIKWARNASLISTLRLEQKRSSTSGIQNYVPVFGEAVQDTMVTNAIYAFRQDLFFFRNNPIGDLQFTYISNASKLYLNPGNEERNSYVWQAKQRLNLSSNKSIENQFQAGNKISEVAMQPDRDFNIEYFSVNPAFNFQVSRKLRTSAGLEYSKKQNFTFSGEQESDVQFQKVSLELKINFKEKNNVFLKAEGINILQNGSSGTSATYEMLEGLRKGKNLVTNVFVTYYITKALELSLNYDLRASGDNPVQHTGRIQLRALF